MNVETVSLNKDVRSRQKEEAEAWRQFLTTQGIFCVNVISSPGAGKTSLLQAIARHWAGQRRIAVLVGDIATNRDAERLSPWMPVRQLTTGGACHLDLALVRSGWEHLGVEGIEFLFIENVGNLVCPSSHDLGEHLRIVVMSVTEGDDKPGKYPKAFRTSQLCVVNKIDLLPHVPFSLSAFSDDVQLVQNQLPLLTTSAINGYGIGDLCDHLATRRQEYFCQVGRIV